MLPDTGNMISFIRFRSGTKSMPVPQQSERKFQIVLDVPTEWVGGASPPMLSQAPCPFYIF